MEMRIQEIADLIDAKIMGNADVVISGVSSLEDAGASDITFAGDKKYLEKLSSISAGAVIVPGDIDDGDFKNISASLLKVENPRLSFFRLVKHFHPPVSISPGIDPSAVIGKGCCMGENICIGANVVIGDNVSIGDDTRIMANTYVGDGSTIGSHGLIKPNVTLMEQTRIGDHVLIHSGTVIGSDGFGFTPAEGGHEKLVHTGYVTIGDRVEIGACNTIDRGTLGTTTIGNGVKTDNQVHIAHNVKIGENTLVVAQVGMAGSAKIGNNVIIAGKSAISGHLTVGDNTIVGPWTGVSSDVAPGQIVSGVPHMPHKTWLKTANITPRLPEMRKTLLALTKQVKAMESKIKELEKK